MSVDRDAWEADQASRGEAAADDAYFAWEDAQVAEITDDPNHAQWVEGHLFFQAAPGKSATVVLMGSFAAGDDPPLVVRREYVIELRDFLTAALEGTLEPDLERGQADAGADTPTIDL